MDSSTPSNIMTAVLIAPFVALLSALPLSMIIRGM